MDLLLSVFMPITLFMMMTIIGAELSREDFQTVKQRPLLVAMVSLCQLIVLPLAVFLIFYLFQGVPTGLMAGMLIMAAGPGGGLSNVLVARANGDVALSIALTSLGSLLCLVTMPMIFLFTFPLILERAGNIEMPVAHMMVKLVLFLLLPVILGMWLRFRWNDKVEKLQPSLRRFNSILLLCLITYSLTIKSELTLADYAGAMPYAVAFMAICGLVGLFFGLLFGLNRFGTRAVVLEFMIQSGAIPTLIIASVLEQMSWLLFAGAAVALQMCVALMLVIWPLPAVELKVTGK